MIAHKKSSRLSKSKYSQAFEILVGQAFLAPVVYFAAKQHYLP
jgi:hypothetical protein